MAQTLDVQNLSTADLANVSTQREPRDMGQPEFDESRPADTEYSGPLLSHDISDSLRTRWEGVQTGFVDDPRVAVQQADELVATAIKELAQSFADERSRLEQQWSKGNDVSTEELRQALRRYRAFFHRLLSL